MAQAYVSKFELGQKVYVREGNTILETIVEGVVITHNDLIKYFNEYGDDYEVLYILKGWQFRRFHKEEIFSNKHDLMQVIIKDLEKTISIYKKGENDERY